MSPSPSLDGAALRAALTAAAQAADTADALALRKAAVAVIAPALAEARQAALARLAAGEGGAETARALSAAIEETVSALYDFATVHVFRARNPTAGEKLSVCAVGGFGRGLLAPGSDIDVMFLHPYKPTPWGESVAEFIQYALWDLKLRLGPSVRTVAQAIHLAKADWTVLTALLDMRVVAGDGEAASDLERRLGPETLRGRLRAFVAAKLRERDMRLERQGPSRYMVEPDLKEGKGALRDLQTIAWLVRGATRALGRNDALPTLVDKSEAAAFAQAEALFWTMRCHLHVIAGRAQDRLTFDLQPELARRMGYADAGAERAVERMMRAYFLEARSVGRLMRAVCARLEADAAKGAPRALARLLPRARRRLRDVEPGIVIEAGRARFEDAQAVPAQPALMMALFRAAARAGADLHPDALDQITKALDDQIEALRASPLAAQAFFEVLLNPETVEPALRVMSECGLLGAYLPEFGRIVARTQFNMYHHYTVDEHTLRVVGGLADLERGRIAEDAGFAAPIFARIQHRRALYLAAVLHDVGKGLGDQQIAGAELALVAAKRLGLSEDEAELTAWLVRRHLDMSDTAQRRDLGEPRTVADFASLVETPERLRLLTLLTIADIRAVGPGVWTAWKRHLLGELYDLAEAAFRGGRASVERVRHLLAQRAEEARAALPLAAPEGEDAFTAAWRADLEDAYWLAFDGASHVRHRDFALSALSRGLAAEVDARLLPERGAGELIVLAPDRPRLFADLAAAIAASGGDVRAARLFTTRAGMAFDIFTLALDDPRDGWSQLAGVAEALHVAIEGGAPPLRLRPPSHRARAFAIEPTVVFDDEASDAATVIEVTGRDRPGLLAALAAALAEGGVNVLSANVESYGERAMDVFYAAEPEGGKIENPARRNAIRRGLLAALAEPEAEGGLARAAASDAR